MQEKGGGKEKYKIIHVNVDICIFCGILENR